MNIALPAAVFLLLIMPGYLWLRCFKLGQLEASSSDALVSRHEGGENADGSSSVFSASTLPNATLVSTALHILWLSGVAWGPFPDAEPLIVLQLVAGSEAIGPLAQVDESLPWVTAYFVSLFLFSGFAAYALGLGSGAAELDLKYPHLFGQRSTWYYLFTGFSASRRPDLIAATVTVDLNDGTYLYSGVIDSWGLNADGRTLEFIRLRFPYRRALARDQATENKPPSLESDERYYAIRGEFFIVWMRNVQTLNIDYAYISTAST